MLEKIAKVIGYHFWHCSTDERAMALGMDCAKEVMKELDAEDENDG